MYKVGTVIKDVDDFLYEEYGYGTILSVESDLISISFSSSNVNIYLMFKEELESTEFELITLIFCDET